jgi:UDP-glucose 4-epimerase
LKTILLTGGCGYIGSHTAVQLIEAGYETVIADNLSNSKQTVLDRIEEITGCKPVFYHIDIRDRKKLQTVFRNHHIDAVIHFAGLKSAPDSVRIPLDYFQNNVTGTLTLCEVMAEACCKTIVFSSSATVYGIPESLPIYETSRLSVTNPYGRTKLMIEKILEDISYSDDEWRVCLLRYFNPVGAHKSGRIGEDPQGIPMNLMPKIAQVAVGRIPVMTVTGNDYDTPDGTGVRDYIHVCDLADGHLKALEYLKNHTGTEVFNLGTGNGFSVMEMLSAFGDVTGNAVPYEICPRRPGDPAACYANCDKAEKVLGWKAKFGLRGMCEDLWRWQSNNPNGY